MHKKFVTVMMIVIILLLTSSALFAYYSINLAQRVETNALNQPDKTHIFGGFEIDTPEKASKAATDGIQVGFEYGQPPSEDDKLGQKLQSLHMKVVDGYIWALIYYYECHRTKTVKPPPSGKEQYCQDDTRPDLTDENAVLTEVAAHLKQVKDNHLIIGYWVLDDWVSWDTGSARQLLIKIHNLIQQYTPGRPAICGFGADIWLNQEYGWDDWVADNFSSQGCDRVGLYIYTSTVTNTARIPSHAKFNWSMVGVLPAIFASLKQRGWSITKEPFIGIGQAFGGAIAHTEDYWITPNATDIETQSRSFCEHGATGLTFYAWNNSGYGPTTQTPINSPEIETGIRNGIAACRQYWSDHPQ